MPSKLIERPRSNFRHRGEFIPQIASGTDKKDLRSGKRQTLSSPPVKVNAQHERGSPQDEDDNYCQRETDSHPLFYSLDDVLEALPLIAFQLLLAVTAVLSPGHRLQTFDRDLLAAIRADAETPHLDSLERGIQLPQPVAIRGQLLKQEFF